MQIVPKWKVTVKFQARADIVLWLYDYNIGNVLRIVAGMQFTENGLDQPTQITVGSAA